MRVSLALLILLMESLWGGPSKIEKNDESFAAKLAKLHIPVEFELEEVVLGNKNAPHTIIIYTSFTCLHCRKFHLKEFRKLRKKYIETGKAKVYLRSYLDDQGALEAAILVRCLGGHSCRKIDGLYQQIFEKQESWMASQDPVQFIRKLFIDLKHSKRKIEECLGDMKISAGLMKEQQRATLKFKISLVPAFIVDGKIYHGFLTCEEIATMFLLPKSRSVNRHF